MENQYLKDITEKCWSNFKPSKTHLHGWFDDSNIKTLNVALERKPKVFLELGTWYGLSTQYILNNSDTHLISVDSFPDIIEDWHCKSGVDGMLKEYPLYKTFLSNFYDHKERLTVIKGMSNDILKTLAKNNVEIDAIYLDTSHTYENTIQEIENVMNYHPNALLTGDDYNRAECGKAIKECAEKYNKKLIVLGKGWYYDN